MRKYHIQKNEREFWEKLEIPVDDALEFENPKKRPWQKLRNIIKKYPGWMDVMDAEDGKSYDFNLVFKNLFQKKKLFFYRVYFLTRFAETIDNNSIKSRLPNQIYEKYKDKLESKEYEYKSLLYSIYKSNRTILENIFYDSLINGASLKSYTCAYSEDIENFLNTWNNELLTVHLKKLNSTGKMRRRFHIWWFENSNEKIKILIRFESKRRSPIHQVTKNTFLKTAGDRIMIFSERGTKLELLAKEANVVANWFNLILTDKLKKHIQFQEVPYRYDSNKIFEFLKKVQLKQFVNISLLSLEVRNISIANSPTISLISSSFDPISDALSELEIKHKLLLLTNMNDIVNFTLGIDGMPYKVTVNTDNDTCHILFDNKSLLEKDKDHFRQVLNSVLA